MFKSITTKFSEHSGILEASLRNLFVGSTQLNDEVFFDDNGGRRVVFDDMVDCNQKATVLIFQEVDL